MDTFRVRLPSRLTYEQSVAAMKIYNDYFIEGRPHGQKTYKDVFEMMFFAMIKIGSDQTKKTPK